MSTTRIEQEQVNSSLPFQRLVGRTRATEGSGGFLPLRYATGTVKNDRLTGYWDRH